MGGWGGGFGGGWGGGAGSAFAVVSALAATDRSVMVTLSQVPAYVTPVNPGDASRVANWTIFRTDVNPAQEIPVLLVKLGPTPTKLEVVVVKPWVRATATYLVTATNLETASGIFLGPNNSAQFFGMPWDQNPVTQQALVDLYNPQQAGELLNGGLVVGSSGDYLNEGGLSLLKKLIIRRIVTRQAEFRHLASQRYGLGVQEKQLWSPADLIMLQKDSVDQIMQEPEVVTVKVGVSLDVQNILTFDVAAKIRNQDQLLSFSFPVMPGQTG